MSLFDILESRMQQIFEGGSLMAPLPFKKLAKQAVHEMKRSAAKVDGRTIAPSLYTVLVNPTDDDAIAPLYQQVTDELVDFVAHEAQNAGLTLLAAPVVRFIPDANIRQGKMDVIAEVVTPDVLQSLRAEEAAYIDAHSNRVGMNRGMRGAAAGRPAPAVPNLRPLQGAAPQAPRAQQAPAAARIPAMQSPSPAQQQAPQPSPAPQAQAPRSGGTTCQLTDVSSGRVWRIGVPSTVIGREESMADLVLRDTNVSRRHAELTHDAAGWHIVDLGSTNGTRVNGSRIQQADLHSGDVVAMGLVSLAFEEL